MFQRWSQRCVSPYFEDEANVVIPSSPDFIEYSDVLTIEAWVKWASMMAELVSDCVPRLCDSATTLLLWDYRSRSLTRVPM